jgi:hypothetical protein
MAKTRGSNFIAEMDVSEAVLPIGTSGFSISVPVVPFLKLYPQKFGCMSKIALKITKICAIDSFH